ncbi:hypothetical protein PybrP1_011885 [[Pythium] brassicae (nom. inval.)]|nr:hypothetical protein PybrP1_011885 [[Pythium] brassicae (nom. inval.)]
MGGAASSDVDPATQWTVAQIPPLAGKVAIVTGANSGIGYETALALARNGAHVVLACRSEPRAMAAKAQIEAAIAGSDRAGSLEFIALDLSSLESVRAFAKAFTANFERLDILVNNAGLMYPEKTHTESGLESQFAVNHLGHFYLTQLLFEPLKRSAGQARVVNVSSVAHRLASLDLATLARSKPNKWFYFGAYNDSKLANLLFTYELHRRIDRAGLGDKVISVCAHPGITSSDLTPKAIEGYSPTFLYKPLRKLVDWSHVFQATALGALPILYAAVAPSVQSGEYFGPNGFQNFRGTAPAREASSSASRSAENAAALWKLSEDLVGDDNFVVK